MKGDPKRVYLLLSSSSLKESDLNVYCSNQQLQTMQTLLMEQFYNTESFSETRTFNLSSAMAVRSFLLVSFLKNKFDTFC